MTECINCGAPPGGEYSLVLPTGVLLQDEPLCATCHAFFSGAAQFEVHAAPLLMRGGNDGDDDRGAEALRQAQQ